MAMFHFDTAFMLEVIALAAGLTLLHFGKSATAALLRAAGWLLIVASIGSASCSIYYAIRYHVQGEFDHAYGVPNACQMGGRGMHDMHGMGGDHPMMGRPGAASPAPETAAGDAMPTPAGDDEHSAHHPEK